MPWKIFGSAVVVDVARCLGESPILGPPVRVVPRMQRSLPRVSLGERGLAVVDQRGLDVVLGHGGVFLDRVGGHEVLVRDVVEQVEPGLLVVEDEEGVGDHVEAGREKA